MTGKEVGGWSEAGQGLEEGESSALFHGSTLEARDKSQATGVPPVPRNFFFNRTIEVGSRW